MILLSELIRKLIGDLQVMINILDIIIILKYLDELHYLPGRFNVERLGGVRDPFQACIIRLYSSSFSFLFTLPKSLMSQVIVSVSSSPSKS